MLNRTRFEALAERLGVGVYSRDTDQYTSYKWVAENRTLELRVFFEDGAPLDYYAAGLWLEFDNGRERRLVEIIVHGIDEAMLILETIMNPGSSWQGLNHGSR